MGSCCLVVKTKENFQGFRIIKGNKNKFKDIKKKLLRLK